MNQTEQPAIRQQILEQVAQPIGTIPVEPGYRIKLMLAAFIAVVAIIIYFLVILAMVYLAIMGAWYGSYLTEGTGSRRGSGLLGLLFVGGPLFAGVCVVIALMKPVLVPAADDKMDDEVELNPQYESYLFEFVRRLCLAVNAPVPAVIAVNGDVNASASFIRGPLDGRLKLTVGLPLVLGMNVQQVAGIIAHEFGHFTQRGGMGLTWLISSICGWFHRATFERDRWDQWLYDNSRSFDSWYVIVLLMARGIVWLVRFIPLGLLILCNFFCARLLQEMEFDADRHEARVAGSQAFRGTVLRLNHLGLASAEAYESLGRFQSEGKLPDNLPHLITSNVALLSPDRFQLVDKEIDENETGRFDTHPANKDRIANAERENAPGTLNITAPASILFRDAQALSRHQTIKLYRQAFDKEFDPRKILATGGIVEQLATENAERKLSDNFLLHQFHMFRTMILPRESLGADMDKANWKRDTEARRQQLLKIAPEFVLLRKQTGDLLEKLGELSAALVFQSCNLKLDSSDNPGLGQTAAEVQTQMAEIARQEADNSRRQEPFRRLLGMRLMDNLEWVRSAGVRQKIGRDEGVVQEVTGLLKFHAQLNQHHLLFERFNFEMMVMSVIFGVFEENQKDELIPTIIQQANRLGHFLAKIRHELEQIPYFFEHGEGEVSMGYYLLPEVPDHENPTEIMAAGGQAIRALQVVIQRIFWRLTSIAAEVEQALGFPLMDLPPGLAETETKS